MVVRLTDKITKAVNGLRNLHRFLTLRFSRTDRATATIKEFSGSVRPSGAEGAITALQLLLVLHQMIIGMVSEIFDTKPVRLLADIAVDV